MRRAESVLTVSDEEIVATLSFILFRMKLLVEPSGAVSAAAVMFGKLPSDLKRVGVVLSGGNVDPELLSKLIDQEPDRFQLNCSVPAEKG